MYTSSTISEKRGNTEKDLAKHGKPALFALLQKYMVAAGAIKIERFEDGIPVFTRGRGLSTMSAVHVTQDTGHVNLHSSRAMQETDDVLRDAVNESQTSSHKAQANARRAKLAYERTTRIVQEKTQEAAQEVKRIAQEATMELRKAKKAKRYRATMEKLGKLPPCPSLCRGGDCNRIPCEEEEPGFSYSHIEDIVVCSDKSHTSMSNRDGCYLFHLWPARKRSKKTCISTCKKLGRGTSGTRNGPPSNNNYNNQRQRTRRRMFPRSARRHPNSGRRCPTTPGRSATSCRSRTTSSGRLTTDS
jgi:hypothetical protein